MFSHKVFYDQLPISKSALKEKALFWADQFPVVAYYDHNQVDYKHQGFEHMLAVSNNSNSLIKPAAAFKNLKEALILPDNNLLCGFFSYDLKNQIEKLESNHPDFIGFPLAYFFYPEIYLTFADTHVCLYSHQDNAQLLLVEILGFTSAAKKPGSGIKMQSRVSKTDYIKKVKAIQQDILEGEVYEINYCIEFFAEKVDLEPLPVFLNLNQVSPMPFAGYFKLQDKYLLCASPERFLKKTGTLLISQPIKGTSRRGQTPTEDAELREKLRTNEKEIAENMMIMDLVRNDLSKSSRIGSVKVEEMFGIYGFPQVFQMITTVTSRLKPDCHLADAIKHAFPMGSMTGAPKIRAMQLIEKYETTRRGLYSGALGYFKPNGDFDFNVVIRSLQYNHHTGYLSFMVGSAITYDSDPALEYEECLLKAKAIISILQ